MSPLRRWEYRRVYSVDLQGGRLEELGEQGWELVAVISELKFTGGARDIYVFKREKA